MCHVDRKPPGLYITHWEQLKDYLTSYTSSNCSSINSSVGRCCVTYGLVAWELYLLCWVRHLSDCASWIREGGEKRGWKWDFIEHSVSVENPGLAHFVKAETSQRPHRGQIQSNVLRADRSNQSAAGCCSPLGFSLGGKLQVLDFQRRRSKTMLVKKT